MKILVVSDNHSSSEELQNLVRRHQEEVECMVHCGDSEFDYDDSRMTSFQLRVRGNCDFDTRYPENVAETVGGKTVFATHGHLYGVKMNLMNLAYKAEETGADLVCFGHSHEATVHFDSNILFLNPGSISLPRKPTIKTYAIVEWVHDEVQVVFYDHQGERVDELTKTYKLSS
ncbi:metallophosphoesterase [Alkalihalobacillus sp. CinArs1]|uniref:metallophosphoesterase n=1 Tax=Alkalihalobacillus sp. CinArs1 TaxID=2995314 RepID=UPI0022DE14F2|nr:metallophosphoesterase [Alkalihalobacillus sp. CinArs1]